MRGKFITLEGPEASGKTTQIPKLLAYLQSKNIEVVQTREPGGTTLGEKLRSILLEKTEFGMCPDSELLLMFAARAEHIHRVIEPALAAGHWVISDRFTDATFAYQGGGRGIPNDRIEVLEAWVQGDFQPDLTLLLDVTVETSMARTTLRGEKDRFEEEQYAFFADVRQHYLARAKAHAYRVRTIDGSQTIDAVEQSIHRAIEGLLL